MTAALVSQIARETLWGKPVTLNLTEDQITKTVGDFIASVLPFGTPIIVGQDNYVPEPGAPDFVIMWPIMRARLAFGSDDWRFITNPTTLQHIAPSRVVIQIDVHGPASSDNAEIIAALWQDEAACDFFDGVGLPMRPLFAEEPAQIPFINGEAQYETRWVVKAHLQANFTVSTAQQFADTLTAIPINVQATYPE